MNVRRGRSWRARQTRLCLSRRPHAGMPLSWRRRHQLRTRLWSSEFSLTFGLLDQVGRDTASARLPGFSSSVHVVNVVCCVLARWWALQCPKNS